MTTLLLIPIFNRCLSLRLVKWDCLPLWLDLLATCTQFYHEWCVCCAGIMSTYGLLEHFDDVHSSQKHKDHEPFSGPAPSSKALFRDKKLNKLWEKAEGAGFTGNTLVYFIECTKVNPAIAPPPVHDKNQQTFFHTFIVPTKEMPKKWNNPNLMYLSK